MPKVNDAMLNVRHGQLVTMNEDFNALRGELIELNISKISSNLRWTVSELIAALSSNCCPFRLYQRSFSIQADAALGRSFHYLPSLPLLTFSGEYSEWGEFHSVFSTSAQQSGLQSSHNSHKQGQKAAEIVISSSGFRSSSFLGNL